MNDLLSLERLIHLQNPWFLSRGDAPSEKFLPKRAFFPEFKNLVDETKQISALIGIRRVGKTVMLKQILAEKLENRGNLPLYFSFDQEFLPTIKNPLGEIIDYYLERILKRKLSQIKQPVYLFFDEIQLVPYWQDILKRYYDLNQNLKFAVSGSSSLFLQKGSKESLAGRIFEQILPPLTFQEYKRAKKDKLGSEASFEEYLQFGGFFEELELPDKQRKREFLKEWVLGKVLERDLPNFFRISDSQIMKILFQVLLGTTGKNTVLSKIASELEVSATTITNYVALLEKTLLVSSLFNLAGSFVRRERRMRKIYPASSNFLLFLPDFQINNGALAETYVFNFLKQKFGSEIFFYQQRGQEVDFLIPEKETALEVKYQEKIHPEDYKNLRLVMNRKKYSRGFLLTKNLKLEQNFKEGKIISLPLHLLETKNPL